MTVLFVSAGIRPACADASPFLYARWDEEREACVLALNDNWARSFELEAVRIEIDEVCRYDEAAHRWESFRRPPQHTATVRIPPRQPGLARPDSELGVLARRTGPYWLRWRENNAPRTGLLYCLRMLCEDLMLGPEPDGHVAACLPEGRARFVPDPARGCSAPTLAPADLPKAADAPQP